MAKYIFLFFLAAFILSCKKDTPLITVKNLNGNEVMVMGHGGSGKLWKFPVDTKESILECLEMGADGSEMDIQMTKDSVLVVFHHKELDQVTDCAGRICDLTWSELEKCAFKYPLVPKIYLSRVEDVFNAAGNWNQYFFTFDCKFYTDSVKIPQFIIPYSNAVLKIIDDYSLESNIMIESSNTDFFKLLQAQKSNLKLFIYPPTFDYGLLLAEKFNLHGITIDNQKITAGNVELAHERGLWVTLWNVQTSSENIDALKKNPDIIQTNKINNLLKITGRN